MTKPGKIREIPVVLLLTFVTFGMYLVWWLFANLKELRAGFNYSPAELAYFDRTKILFVFLIIAHVALSWYILNSLDLLNQMSMTSETVTRLQPDETRRPSKLPDPGDFEDNIPQSNNFSPPQQDQSASDFNLTLFLLQAITTILGLVFFYFYVYCIQLGMYRANLSPPGLNSVFGLYLASIIIQRLPLGDMNLTLLQTVAAMSLQVFFYARMQNMINSVWVNWTLHHLQEEEKSSAGRDHDEPDPEDDNEPE